MKKSKIRRSSTVEQIPVKNEAVGSSPTAGAYPPEQLLDALFYAWDAFDRSMMNMFLLYSTAESAINNVKLCGDKITVGCRILEWLGGNTSILKTFMGQPIEITETYEVFLGPHQIPIYVYLFNDDPTITSLDTKMYENEYFRLPNPYSRFLERFGTPL